MNETWYILTAIKQKYLQVAMLLLLGLFNNSTLAQEDSPRIKHFTEEDGFIHSMPMDMLKDSLGFVWIASGDGLSRFDGKEFKHFWHDETDNTSISGNAHPKLYTDKKGNIWTTSPEKGLKCYDPRQGTFKNIKIQNTKDTQLIYDFTIDDNNTIWAATLSSGLYRLSPTAEGSFSKEVLLPGQKLCRISRDSNGNIWVGGYNGEVYTFDPSVEDISKIKLKLNVNSYIRAFYPTKKKLLIGGDRGLYIYDLESEKGQWFHARTGVKGISGIVYSFLREDDTKVWVGTQFGMYLLDFEKMKVVQKIIVEDSTDEVNNKAVYTLTRLSDSQILSGSGGRLDLIDFSEPHFKNVFNDGSDESQFNKNFITAIYKDEGNLWIGTTGGGLNLIRNGKYYHFRGNSGVKSGDAKTILGSAVTGISKDHQNQRLWISTYMALNMIDLKTFDPDNPKFIVFGPYWNNFVQNNTINDVAIDQKGNVWVATAGNGIFRLEQTKGAKTKIVRYKRETGNSNSLVNDFTWRIKIDQDHTIWIGTMFGLSKLTFLAQGYEQPKFTNYFKDVNLKESLSDNAITDILVDAKKRVWVGTRHGLNLFMGNNKFEPLTARKQFPNGFPISAIQDDAFGNLWLSSADNIVKFNPEKEIFTTYGSEDGLPNKGSVMHSKFRGPEGNIYFGTTKGFVHFHPDDLKNMDQPQPLHFSELRIRDSIITPQNTPNSILKQSLLNTEQLQFRHDQFPFYLRFSSIDFRLEKNVEYGYKLLPTDKEWNMLSDPEIQFLNLPSGSHTLLVNGFSRGKIWEQAPLKMNLYIIPPWWATWWAYTLYVLFAGTLAYWFYRFQLSRKLAVSENLRLKEVNQLKNSLYTNITHEFRTPLTVILGMADSLKSTLEKEELDSTRESLEMIQRNGNNLLRLVNEMLDLAKLESGNMELQPVQADVVPFIKYLCESFHSMAKASQIDLTVYSEIDELVMDFDANKMTTIISNLLSNAIKFTRSSGKIVVHLNKIPKNGNDHFFIRVKDDGLGISEAAMPHIFDRFYQADGSSSRKGEGSGIGLALTKEFTELMGGTIEVKSTVGKGSEFNVQIPITKNAHKMVDVRPSPVLALSAESEMPIPFEEAMESDTQLPLLLIIEDNFDVAHYLKTCLQGKYEIRHAADGIIGIETAFEKVPDIVICDVMMPGKDGYEVCATLKADERTDHIPIIMLTAKVTIEDRITGISHGADAYLAKPFNKVELFTRLNQLILLRKKMRHKLEKEGFGGFLKKRAENPEAKFLQKAIKLIHQEMSDHSFGSRHLARKLLLSESQIYRKLKAITGKSTAIFIRSVRLQRAKELIQTTKSTISEIAYDVGFNDPSWFSRAFKEEFGFTPSELSK